MRGTIVWSIYRKELTEALRDRLTLIVLIALPLVMYPLIMFGLLQFARQQAVSDHERVLKIAVWADQAQPLFDWLSRTNQRLTLERWLGAPEALRTDLAAGRLPPPPLTQEVAPARPRTLGPAPPSLDEAPEDDVLRAARAVVAARQADAVVVVWPGFEAALQTHDAGRVSVYYDSVIATSDLARARLSAALGKFREQLQQERIRERALPPGFVQALNVQSGDVAPVERRLADVLGRVLPMLLILLSVTGAMVAAVDMTAGEKDRATMQTLLCAPVRPWEIVGGKFLAVWSLSLISASANLLGIGLTLGRVAAVMQIEAVSWGGWIGAMGLLLPATWTISALFVAVAVLARDVKDAGNFLGALTFVVVLPMTITLLPGVELDAWTAMAPLVNLALLIRALLTGAAPAALVFLTLLTSITYAGLALGLAARVFGREQNLLGGAFSWRDLFRRTGPRSPTPTPATVLALFPVAVVGVFHLSLSLAPYGLAATLVATQFGVLLATALLVAWGAKYSWVETFSLRFPSGRSVAGAVLIGLSASVGVGGLVLRLAPPPESFVNEMREALQFGAQPAPLWKLYLLIALTPALCEETFFRGLMLSGLRRWGPWAAIGVTALLFGLLHGSIYRLLPTFLLGLLLGYAVWRSGSLFCGFIIHGLNNGLIATLLWWGGSEAMAMKAVPWSLILPGLALTAAGVALLRGRRVTTAPP
jgi:sodium transport system permease protein